MNKAPSPAWLTAAAFLFAATSPAADPLSDRVAAVAGIPGCVAFWDFVKREPSGLQRFTAHVPAGSSNDYALDAGNYVRDFWGEGPEASYNDFLSSAAARSDRPSRSAKKPIRHSALSSLSRAHACTTPRWTSRVQADP